MNTNTTNNTETSNTNVDNNIINENSQKCTQEEILFLMKILEENATLIRQKMMKKNKLEEEIESLYNEAMEMKETIPMFDLSDKDIKRVKKIQNKMNKKIEESSILNKEINAMIEFGDKLSDSTLKLILLNNFDEDYTEEDLTELEKDLRDGSDKIKWK